MSHSVVASLVGFALRKVTRLSVESARQFYCSFWLTIQLLCILTQSGLQYGKKPQKECPIYPLGIFIPMYRCINCGNRSSISTSAHTLSTFSIVAILKRRKILNIRYTQAIYIFGHIYNENVLKLIQSTLSLRDQYKRALNLILQVHIS